MNIKRLLPTGLLSCTAALSLTMPARAQVTSVPAASASANFAETAKHLELGGLFYGFVDVDGDLAKLGKIGDRLLDAARKQGAADLPKELKASKILDALGLTTVKALGGSSRTLSGGMYHNRAIVYAPAGPVGLFKLLGGKAAPLASPSLAPAGSDLVGETDLNLSALLEIAESVVKSIGDERLMQQYKGSLGFPVPGLPMTVGDLISKLDTKIIVFGELVDGKSIPIPNSKDKFPAFKAVLSFDNIDFLFEPLLQFAEQAGQSKVEKGDGFELIRPAQPLPGDFSYFQPVVYHDLKTKRILIASHLDYLRAALTGAKPLTGDPTYLKATEGLPKEGNSFSYVTPKVAVAVLDFVKMAMKSAPNSAGGPPKELMEEVMRALQEFSPLPASAMAAVRANLPDGMLFLSNESNNFKNSVVAVGAVFPAIMIAGGVGAYQGVIKGAQRHQAETEMKKDEVEKTEESSDPAPAPTPGGASTKAIKNNLQQITYSAQTYFLDNPKAKEVTYEKLIGTELLFKLDPVAGESYKGLTVKRAGGSLTVKTGDKESISLSYQPVTD
ncbi:MAG: hypothetical protein V4726_03265 [Verrucomicrobiota bacterium]